MEKYKILSNKKIKDALEALGEFGQNCLVDIKIIIFKAH